MYQLIWFKFSNDMAKRLNLNRVASRDEFSTNQIALLCDVTYLIYTSQIAGKRAVVCFEKHRWELRGKTGRKFSYICDRNQKSLSKWWVLSRIGSKKLAYSNKCRVILPVITKFVACWERRSAKNSVMLGGGCGVLQNYIRVHISVFFVYVLVDIAVAQR